MCVYVGLGCLDTTNNTARNYISFIKVIMLCSDLADISDDTDVVLNIVLIVDIVLVVCVCVRVVYVDVCVFFFVLLVLM